MKKNILSASFLLTLLTASLSPASPIFAEPETPGFHSVSDAKIHQLEQLHQKAEEHILKNDFRAAIRLYQDILLLEPDDETAYTGLGQCYLVTGDFPRAKEAYLNALQINANNETAALGLKKIADPDSMTFFEEHSVKSQDQNQDASAPVQKEAPAQKSVSLETKEELQLGAKKIMAPYSAGLPASMRHFSREQLIQAALKNAGLYQGPMDGVLGPNTRQAIKNFQIKYDLAADGKVGHNTWALLQPYLYKYSFEDKTPKNGAAN